VKDIAVIVGNGFSIDLCSNFFPNINTSRPIDRNYIIEQQPPLMARAAFPQVFQAWEKFKATSDDQFEFFRSVKSKKLVELEVEARHLLAMCYSDISLRLNIRAQWRWTRFFQSIAHRLRTAISFNYDRVLEGTFTHLGIQYSQNEIVNNCILLLKPHGSCNMDCNPSAIAGLIARYPLNNWLSANDYEQCLVPTQRLMQPRLEAFCILPHEQNLYKRFQWQDSIWNAMESNLSPIRHCILIGHSYGAADQPEIDEIVSKLASGTVLHLCNPNPPPSYARLDAIAGAKGLQVKRHEYEPTHI